MSKANLKPIYTEPERAVRPSFAIDEPYRKPVLKKPNFKVELIKPEKPTHLKNRIKEINARVGKAKPEKLPFIDWLRKYLKP